MLYYKIINGQTKISQCKAIQLEDGTWVSNPSQQTILENGWSVYEPPEVVPQPQVEPDYEQVMEAIKKMLSTETEALSDEEALQVAALHPTWISKVGEQVNANERYWYDGKLYKVVQPHIVQEDWTPDVSMSLFTEVSVEEWPEWVQPTGSSDAYMTGDKVTFEGRHCVSLIDYNIYSPAVYPAGWLLQ